MGIIIGIILGCIIAGIIVGSMWSSLISVNADNRADNYVRKDSLHLQTNTDTFVSTRTDKKEKPKSPPPQS